MNEPAESRLLGDISRSMFEAMAETFTDIAYTALPDGSWDFVNARIYEITGLPVGSALGKGWIEALYPEERVRVLGEWQEAIDSGTPFESHFRIQTAQEESRRFVARAHFVGDETGRTACWVGTATDVHDLLAAEDALQQAARENDEAISKLTHDLRNLLAPISNAAALLRLPGADATQRQWAVEIIDGQVRDLRALLDKVQPVPPSRRNLPAKPFEAIGSLKQPSRRILIVSSDGDFGEEWSMLLRLAGHDVCAVRDVQQALDLSQAFQPEIVVVNFPVLARGEEWVQRLRTQPVIEKAPIVAICEGNDTDPLPRPVLGCAAVLCKPVKIQDFLELIAEQETLAP